MPTTILDGFGRPAQYQGPRIHGEQLTTAQRKQRADYFRDYISMVSRWDYQQIVSAARLMKAVFSPLAGAIEQKANYVSRSGWRPQFTGEDRDYGKLVEEKLKEAAKVFCVRGPAWHRASCWWIVSTLWDRDGECYCLPTKTATGFPVFQFLECHRVGSRYGRTLAGKQYDGLPEINGIVYNEQGREIAYNVLGKTEDDDRYISARDMWRLAAPDDFSGGRAMPAIIAPLLDFIDIKEARGAEKIAQKVNSKLSLIESNESGLEDLPNYNAPDQSTNTTAGGVQVDEFEDGEIRIIKNGNSLQSHKSERPSEGWLKFDERIMKGALYALGWRYEMVTPEGLTSANQYAVADAVNVAIATRFDDLMPFAVMATQYQVAVLQQRGDIPQHEEWWKWGFTPPAEFTPNASRTGAQDLKNLEAGVTSEVALISKTGRDPEEVIREQARFKKRRVEIFKEEDVIDDVGNTDSSESDSAPQSNSATQSNED